MEVVQLAVARGGEAGAEAVQAVWAEEPQVVEPQEAGLAAVQPLGPAAELVRLVQLE